MYIISVFHKRHYLLELADIVIYCFYTVLVLRAISVYSLPFTHSLTIRERCESVRPISLIVERRGTKMFCSLKSFKSRTTVLSPQQNIRLAISSTVSSPPCIKVSLQMRFSRCCLRATTPSFSFMGRSSLSSLMVNVTLTFVASVNFLEGESSADITMNLALPGASSWEQSKKSP